MIDHGAVVSEVRYGHFYNDLCERFYSNCDLVLNLVQLAAGSTVVVSAVGQVPAWLSATSAAVIGVISLVSMQWQPSVKAERHRVAAAAFLELQGSAWELKTARLSKEIADIRKGAPPGLRSAEMPAYNRTLKALGYPPEKLAFTESVFDLVA